MTPYGLPPPPSSTATVAPPTRSIGGVLPVKSLSDMMREDTMTAEAIARAEAESNSLVVQGLVGQLRKHWTLAKEAKEKVEQDMLSAVRARRGEYDPDKLSKIKQQGGSEIYMMLFATKARQAKALLVDILLGEQTEKPWSVSPTPVPELPPQEVQAIMEATYEQVAMAEMSGMPMSVADIRAHLQDAKQQLENQINETARIYAERAENKIEDLLAEGGWLEAMDQFLDDMMCFKTAFIKGPVVRNIKCLKWEPAADGSHQPTVKSERKLQWERVDPFNIYPAPWATSCNDGFLIERHKLTRSALNALIGIEGYSEDAIRAVLDAHGTGGLHEWLAVDSQKAQAEGRDTLSADQKRSELIDALQYWGCVSGKMLLEWGMDKAEVPDPAKEYEVEAWLIGHWVIKVVLNPDPLYRRPYYSDGYSRIPGAFWHNSLYDVIRDCQDMCNSAARALANNLGISSGPQVSVNIDRVAPSEAITEMHPWKIWQFTADPLGSSAAPIDFFQPNSNSQELMTVFQRFSELADEYSGIPRYMTGLAGGEGGAGRTASGMSMMIGNASKQIKQLLGSIDLHITAPVIEGAYEWLMQYDPDSGLKGDLKIVARGAMSLVTKEAAQVRRNEFLQTTANPFDLQILGMEGRAEVLREAAKGLNLNTDKVVPSASVLKQRMMMAQLAAMQQQAMALGQGAGAEGGPAAGNGQSLQNGAPVEDQFSPQ